MTASRGRIRDGLIVADALGRRTRITDVGKM